MIAAPPYLRDKRYTFEGPGEDKTAARKDAAMRCTTAPGECDRFWYICTMLTNRSAVCFSAAARFGWLCFDAYDAETAQRSKDGFM